MTLIQCQYPGCKFVAENDSEAVAVAMFNSHLLSHSRPTTNTTPKQKPPPIQRPEIKQDVTEEDWATFLQEWNHFKRCTLLPQGSIADQLFQCCERGLGRLLLRENPDVITGGETSLLEAMKKMAVVKVATSVRRQNLMALKQDHGESFREFYANVKSAAATCAYTIKCPHACCDANANIDYTSMVVKEILVAGIADNEIRKDVLGWSELDDKGDKEVVKFVEEKEIARNAWAGKATGAAGISGFKKAHRSTNDEATSIKSKLAQKGNCSKCGSQISLYKSYRSGNMNRTPFHMCGKCHRDSTKSNNQADGRDTSSRKTADEPSDTNAITSFIGAMTDTSADPRKPPVQPVTPMGTLRTSREGPSAQSLVDKLRPVQPAPAMAEEPSQSSNAHWQSVVLDHHIFTPGGWQKVHALKHPTLRLRVSTLKKDYSEFSVPFPKIAPKHVDVVVDSGAQSCLWSRREFIRSGFNPKGLIPVRHIMKAANAAPIKIDGAILLRLSGHNKDGKDIEAAVMTYISPDSNDFFISKEAMIQLGIIPHNFP